MNKKLASRPIGGAVFLRCHYRELIGRWGLGGPSLPMVSLASVPFHQSARHSWNLRPRKKRLLATGWEYTTWAPTLKL